MLRIRRVHISRRIDTARRGEHEGKQIRLYGTNPCKPYAKAFSSKPRSMLEQGVAVRRHGIRTSSLAQRQPKCRFSILEHVMEAG